MNPDDPPLTVIGAE
jgi:broad specificity phosphatase PhoE